MRRLLLVGGRPLAALEPVLTAAGFELETAPDGFYATTLLERSRPAAVLVTAELPDMTAGELAQILAGDPALAGIRRVLVTPAEEGAADAAASEHFDLVLPAGTPAQSALLLRMALDRPPTAAGSSAAGPAILAGTLDAIDFPQLIQMLAANRVAGLLVLSLAPEARVFFDRGDVVHCEWGDLQGRRAFREVLRTALAAGAPFRYRRLGLAEAFRVNRTLGASIQELLIDSAIELDESRDDGPAAERGPRGA